MGHEFQWDDAKARRNARRHGVRFLEAATVFADPLARTTFDPVHSDFEDRYVITGRSNRGRVLVVVYTERRRTIRIITAHRATRRERRSYEQG